MLNIALYTVFYVEYCAIVIEVGRLWRCLVLLEVTSLSFVLLSLHLSMFTVSLGFDITFT